MYKAKKKKNCVVPVTDEKLLGRIGRHFFFFFWFVLWLTLKMLSRDCLSLSEDASDTYLKDFYLNSI